MSMINKIAVIASDYPAQGHMRLVFVQQLVHAMIDQGASITVIAPQSIVHALFHREQMLPKLSYAKTQEGNEYKVLRPRIITLGNTRIFSKILNFWNGIIIKKVLNNIQPDVLYAHFWNSALFVKTYAKKNNKPLFVACGEGDNALEELVDTLSSKDMAVLREIVKGVVSVSTENKRKCIEYNLIDSERIEVFPNCVNTDLFQKKDKLESRNILGIKDTDFVIVFVGGFIPRKGPDRLAQAVNIINDPSIKVLFIGKEFSGYPFSFDCPGIVHKGPVDHDSLPIYLNSADVFVLPTQKEGCCNAIVEALSVGVPVISSNKPFNDDILDEQNSIRIDPDDVIAIKDAIIMLKNNPDLRKKMSDVSLSRHDIYSVQGRAKRILCFIQKKLLNNN